MPVGAPSVNNTTNYLVPAAGQTHAVQFQGQFSAAPFPIDWRQFKIDQFPFQPQGVFVDNSAGTVPLVITILPLGWKVTCAAGAMLQAQFPAPNSQTATVTGDPGNTATVVFVDFPVLPSGNVVTVSGSINAIISGIGATVMNANDNPLAAGNTLPYRTQEYVTAAEQKYGSINGALVSTTVTPSAPNKNLRKMTITFSGDSVITGGGELTINATLNGVPIYGRTIFLPSAVPTPAPATYDVLEGDFSLIGLNAGAGGLVLTIGHALASGVCELNAYFTAQ